MVKIADFGDILYEAFEHTYECIVVVDGNGMIVYMNKTYEEFLNVHDAVGRQVTEVIENTRMHIVAKTGEAEIASVQRIHGREMIANRIPIFSEGKVVAVIGTVMFQDVRQLYALASTVDRLRQEVDTYKEELRIKFRHKLCAMYTFEQIIGESPAFQAVKHFAEKVSKSDTTVLITGESGTGKELFAHAIHAASQRSLGPFVRINCAAIPDSLLESELFGYEEGAFTGAARKGKKGKFELAHHGTILLDEIGDMPLSLQAKLLRVLQEKEVERIGGTRPVSVDVRVISSTNQHLSDLVEKKKFREDLFYRLNVVNVNIPPLRERPEDLPLLVNRFLDDLQGSTGLSVKHIEDGAWNVLRGYSWPGNIRQLRNVLERSLYYMDSDTMKAEHVSIPISAHQQQNEVCTLKESVRMAEKTAIIRALTTTNGNRIQAAKLLDISKSTLYQKIEDLKIDI
jgi:transcriptional regulator with PAS, ATPase and Fis domain